MAKWENAVIDENCGTNEIMGGYKRRILIAPVCMIKTFPKRKTIVDDPTPLEELCLFTGTFEFKDGYKPFIIDCIPGSVNYKTDPQGEIGSESLKPSGTFRVKDKDKADGLAKAVLNQESVMVFQDHNGSQIMIGDENLPVSIHPAYDSGTAAADARGYSFTFDADGSFFPKQKLVTPIDFTSYLDSDDEETEG